jgi:hypothetical protein
MLWIRHAAVGLCFCEASPVLGKKLGSDSARNTRLGWRQIHTKAQQQQGHRNLAEAQSVTQ